MIDIIIDFEVKNEQETYNIIKNELEEKFKDYNIIIVLDKDYNVS